MNRLHRKSPSSWSEILLFFFGVLLIVVAAVMVFID